MDDLSFDVAEPTQAEALASFERVAARAVQLIQEDLQLPFAPEKAVSLASSRTAQVKAHKLAGLPAAAKGYQARRLGADHTLTRRPAKQVQTAR